MGAIGVAIVVIGAIYAYLALSSTPLQEDIPGTPEYDLGETIIQGPPFFTPVWNDCLEDYRPDYGLPCNWQQLIFGGLPKVPADMADMAKIVFESGTTQGVNLDRLTPNYWMQPEFYPGWSRAHVDNTYRELDPERSTPIGFASYPFGHGLKAREGTGAKLFRTFLKDGWGITAWQAMVLSIEMPGVAIDARGMPLRDDNGELVTQDSAIAARMNPRFTFDNDPIYEAGAADLVEPLPDDARMVVLAPNYPSFGPGWVIPIGIEVDLSELPAGTYFFVVWAHMPSAEINSLYTFEYGLRYQPSGFGIPIFEGLIVVV